MKIWSKNIVGNYLEEKFGANDKTMPNINGMPTTSFHLEWEDLPSKTKSLAIIMDDYDAIPPTGFTWIHWVACNIDPSLKELPVDASVKMKDKFVQGKNSWASGLLGNSQVIEPLFGGCAPPDKDHVYVLTVYALDTYLDLKNGFFKNELLHKMHGHVLEKKEMFFKYKQIKQ